MFSVCTIVFQSFFRPHESAYTWKRRVLKTQIHDGAWGQYCCDFSVFQKPRFRRKGQPLMKVSLSYRNIGQCSLKILAARSALHLSSCFIKTDGYQSEVLSVWWCVRKKNPASRSFLNHYTLKHLPRYIAPSRDLIDERRRSVQHTERLSSAKSKMVCDWCTCV